MFCASLFLNDITLRQRKVTSQVAKILHSFAFKIFFGTLFLCGKVASLKSMLNYLD